MITLFTFGPAFGLPDPSSFVTKTDVLLKMSGLPYRCATADVRKAPKGKLPYVDDDGTIVADSTFIRWHLESRHGIDFDKALTSEQRGTAWAVEKMCEEHLYWAIVENRWMIDANFEKGPRHFFKIVPGPLRPFVTAMVRRQVGKNLHAQGMGRHARSDIERLAGQDLQAIAAVLGDKPFLMGAEPCGADASVFASVLSVLAPYFEGPISYASREHANLVAYADRCLARWYPDLKPASA